MLKMTDNVIAFAADKVDVYKAFGDYVNHYKALNGEKVEYDKELSFEEKSGKMQSLLKEEIARVAGVTGMDEFAPEVFASNPQFQWATFAVVGAMIDMVLPQTIIDSVGLYTEVKVGGWGDSFAFDCKPNDIFVITKSGRGKRQSEIKKQFDGQVTVLPVEHDITVGVSLYRVLAGKENLAEFAMKAVRAIETQMTLDVYGAFEAAMEDLTASATLGSVLRYTGYSQDKLIKLAQTVSAYNQGAKAIIAGTQLALSKVLPADDNYRFDLDGDYVKVGYLRNFMGFDVMMLPQVADQETLFDTKLNDNRLYILSPAGSKMIKLCLEGALMSKTDDAFLNANLTQKTVFKKAWGTGLATNHVFGCIDLA